MAGHATSRPGTDRRQAAAAPGGSAGRACPPFGDDAFDVVLCGWVIETVDDPAAAVQELLRVLRPDGLLTYFFCSRPTSRSDRRRTGPLRAIVRSLFAGHFLAEEQTHFHDCDRSSRRTFAGGWTCHRHHARQVLHGHVT